MRCPTCGFENLLGSDVCDNCGSDLAGHDTPQSATTFRGQLLGEHLDALGVAPPETIDADAPTSTRRSGGCTTRASTASSSSTAAGSSGSSPTATPS